LAGPDVLGDTPTQCIVLVLGSHQQSAAAVALFGSHEAREGIVTERPRLAGLAVGLADDVAAWVVVVTPGAVAQQPVARSCLVARHRPVAVEVVAVRRKPESPAWAGYCPLELGHDRIVQLFRVMTQAGQ